MCHRQTKIDVSYSKRKIRAMIHRQNIKDAWVGIFLLFINFNTLNNKITQLFMPVSKPPYHPRVHSAIYFILN